MENESIENLAELLTLRKEVDKWGITAYYNKDGQYHRIHGPAIIHKNGSGIWFKNGKRHRINGPAVEYADGWKEWWEDGTRLSSDYS